MADVYDVLTLDEAKSVVRISGTDNSLDTQLARVVTTVSRRLDDGIGPTIARLVTSERHSGGRHKIELYQCPVLSVSSVTEYQSTHAVNLTEETVGVEPTDGWYGERYKPQPSLYSGVIVRRLGGFNYGFWYGAGNVAVTYTAGRSTTVSLVDARIKEAAGVMLRNWWRSYEQSVGGFDEYQVPQQNFPTFGVPNAAMQILRDLWKPETGFGA